MQSWYFSLGPSATRPSVRAMSAAVVLEQERKTLFLNEQKVGMLRQKRTDTRGVGISSMISRDRDQ